MRVGQASTLSSTTENEKFFGVVYAFMVQHFPGVTYEVHQKSNWLRLASGVSNLVPAAEDCSGSCFAHNDHSQIYPHFIVGTSFFNVG